VILIIDINKVAKKDPLQLCKSYDSDYKKTSRYIGFITQKIELLFLAQGFRKKAISSGLEQSIIIFSKGPKTRKIKNVLAFKRNDIALIEINFEEEALLNLISLLKKYGIGKESISYLH